MDWLKTQDLDKVQDEYQDQIDAFMIDSVQLMMVKLLNISESLFTKISKKTSRNIIFIYKAVTNFIVTVCFVSKLKKIHLKIKSIYGTDVSKVI